MIQGHRNPFGKPLADYTTAEMDFVLEMAALDEPDRWTFVRDGQRAGASDVPKARAEWHGVLGGRLAVDYMLRTGIAAGNANVAAWRARQGGGLRPGLSRGGKALDDAGHPHTG